VASTYQVQVKNVAGVKKITASLDASMPTNTTLTMTMAAPSGATSAGPVVMSTTTTDMVVNIAGINPASTQAITYAFSATVAAEIWVVPPVAPVRSSVAPLVMLWPLSIRLTLSAVAEPL